jgi:hypothetical protein
VGTVQLEGKGGWAEESEGTAMHERFNDGWRAADYVASGLLTDFPNSLFEVALMGRGQCIRRVCHAHEAGAVIAEFSKSFPKASVYYYPEEEFGYLAEVHCHCGHEKSPNCCKHGGGHRTKVRITFKAVEYATRSERRLVAVPG